MGSSSAEEGLIDTLTAERDEAQQLADRRYHIIQEKSAEIKRLRQALGEYGEHDAGCPKRYVQEQLCASLKTEGKCECGLDKELGLPAAAPSAAPGTATKGSARGLAEGARGEAR